MSPLARRRDGRNPTRAVKNLMPTSRRRRVSGAGLSDAAAGRLLDGGDDGPLPLRQLLAAAIAPATAAELEGEAVARAAFRTSVNATEVPLGGPRRARAKTATAIVTAKIIAALTLTAGTAGGVVLATHSYSADLQQSPGISRTDTAVKRVSPAPITISTTAPPTQASGADAPSDSATGVGGSGEAVGDGTRASSSGLAGRCEPLCTTKTTRGSATPSRQPDQHTGNGKHSADGNNPDKEKAAGNGKEKVDNGNGSGKEKKAGSDRDGVNNGNGSGKEKSAGNSSHSVKDANVGGEGQSGHGSKQAGVEKGSEKKADAGTTTTI